MPPSGVDQKRSRIFILWLALIVAVAVVPYLAALDGGFVLDDQQIILDNPVAHSIALAPKAFITPFLCGFYNADSLYYRPLTTISFQANYSASGPNATPFRVTNLVLYALICVVVFALARTLTGSDTAAGVAGLFFAALPSHAESVAWISGRTDLLAALFTLASFAAFVANYVRRPAFSWPLAAVCSALLGCAVFSKESALVLPLVFALYVWIFGTGIRKDELLKWSAAILPMLVFYLIMRHVTLGSTFDAPFTYYLRERIIRIGLVHSAYLQLMFVPQEFRIQYYANPFRMATVSPGVVAAWLAPIALVAVPVLARRRLPVIAFGVGWMLVNLLPASDLLPVRTPAPPMERLVFTASFGSAMILGWLVWKAVGLRPRSFTLWPIAVGALAGAYALNAGLLEFQGALVFETRLSWARYVHKTKPTFWVTRAAAASYLSREGYLREGAEEYEAILKYGGLESEQSARLAHCLGLLYVSLDDLPKAARLFEQATRTQPDFAEGWRGLGKVSFRLRRYARSIEAFERTSKLAPLAPRDHLELGLAYKELGRTDDAVPEFRLAIKVGPATTAAQRAKQELETLER